jgi:hypothetical protein
VYVRDLKCDKGHTFECFFDTKEEMESELKKNGIKCLHCDSRQLTQNPCGPRVSISSPKKKIPLEVQRRIAAYREKIHRTHEDVGTDLYRVNCGILDGREPDRSLVGSCKPDQAVELKKRGRNLQPMPPIMDIENN